MNNEVMINFEKRTPCYCIPYTILRKTELQLFHIR